MTTNPRLPDQPENAGSEAAPDQPNNSEMAQGQDAMPGGDVAAPERFAQRTLESAWQSRIPFLPVPPTERPVKWTSQDVWQSIIVLVTTIVALFITISIVVIIISIWSNFDETAATPFLLLLNQVPQAAMLGLVIYFVILRERGWLSDLGFHSIPWRQLGIIAVVGALALWAVVIIYTLGAQAVGLDFLVPPDLPPEFASGVPIIIILFVSTVLVAPVVEEMYFRGFAYPALRDRYGAPVAALITSGLFGLAHISFGLIIPLSIVGLILLAAFRLTGSLWANIGIHMLYNLTVVIAFLALTWYA